LITEVSGVGASSLNLSNFYLLKFLVMSVTMVGVFVVPYILVEEKESTHSRLFCVAGTYTDVVIGKGCWALLRHARRNHPMAMKQRFTGNVWSPYWRHSWGQSSLCWLAAHGRGGQDTVPGQFVELDRHDRVMLPGMFGDFLAPRSRFPRS